MSNDGADRRKARIDALSDFIRESGTSGRGVRETTVWARRKHGLTEATAKGYIDTLLDACEIVLVQCGQKYRHSDTYPKKVATP